MSLPKQLHVDNRSAPATAPRRPWPRLRAIAFALVVLLASAPLPAPPATATPAPGGAVATLPTPDGWPEAGLSAVPVPTYRAYLPLCQPWPTSTPATYPGPAAQGQGQASPPAAPPTASPLPTMGFVTRNGEDLELDGRPYTFTGVNCGYLAGPYFPEYEVETVMDYFAAHGVEAVRVWCNPGIDLDRVERLLDMGARRNIRFILVLQDFFGMTDGWRFKHKYKEIDLPHIHAVVPRFAHRPEVLMWELMNEPLCPAQDDNRACWEAYVTWAAETSAEIKRLDPNHLVSIGTYRAEAKARAQQAFRDAHALETIDIVSVHGPGGELDEGMGEREMAIAHELGKPVYVGEVYLRGFDKSCRSLGEEVLQGRAERIAQDLEQAPRLGLDGYLLWQYAHGEVPRPDGAVDYYCGEYDYARGDPAWAVLEAYAGE